MTEAEFSRKRVIPRLEEYGFKIDSFEFSANQSRPDLYLVHTGYGYSFWIELKILDGRRISFQPGQCTWLESHIKSKGKCYVLTTLKNDMVGLFDAKHARWLSTADFGLVATLEKISEKSLCVFHIDHKESWSRLCTMVTDDLLRHWEPF